MYIVSLSQVELFHLRILLMIVRGATSFKNLKTVNGEIKRTFTAACLSFGFTKNDGKQTSAMRKTEVSLMPKQLRSSFVLILIYCYPLEQYKLWINYRDLIYSFLQTR